MNPDSSGTSSHILAPRDSGTGNEKGLWKEGGKWVLLRTPEFSKQKPSHSRVTGETKDLSLSLVLSLVLPLCLSHACALLLSLALSLALSLSLTLLLSVSLALSL